MRVLVCGGRTFNNAGLLIATLDRMHLDRRFSLLIHGGAKGADTLAGDWAQHRGVCVTCYPAKWSLGKRAGLIRNQQMLDEGRPELVVAFRGGTGTTHMTLIAEKAGIETILIGWDSQSLQRIGHEASCK